MFTLKRITTITFAILLTMAIFGCSHGTSTSAEGDANIQFGPGESFEMPSSGSESDDGDKADDDSGEKFFALKSISNDSISKTTNLSGEGKLSSRDGTITFSYDDEGRLSKSVLHQLDSSGRLPNDDVQPGTHKMNVVMDITWSGQKPEYIKATIEEESKWIDLSGTEQRETRSTKIDAEAKYSSDGKILQVLEIMEKPGSDIKRTLRRYTYNGNIRSSEVLHQDDSGSITVDGVKYISREGESITLEYGENNLAKKLEDCIGVGSMGETCRTDEYGYDSDNRLESIEEKKPGQIIFGVGETIVGKKMTVIRDSDSGMAMDYTTIVEKHIDGDPNTVIGNMENPTTTLNSDGLPVMEETSTVETHDELTRTFEKTQRYEYTELNKKPIMLPMKEFKITRTYITPSILLIFDNPEMLYMPLK